jgi:hypothetical protein
MVWACVASRMFPYCSPLPAPSETKSRASASLGRICSLGKLQRAARGNLSLLCGAPPFRESAIDHIALLANRACGRICGCGNRPRLEGRRRAGCETAAAWFCSASGTPDLPQMSARRLNPQAGPSRGAPVPARGRDGVLRNSDCAPLVPVVKTANSRYGNDGSGVQRVRGSSVSLASQRCVPDS